MRLAGVEYTNYTGDLPMVEVANLRANSVFVVYKDGNAVIAVILSPGRYQGFLIKYQLLGCFPAGCFAEDFRDLNEKIAVEEAFEQKYAAAYHASANFIKEMELCINGV